MVAFGRLGVPVSRRPTRRGLLGGIIALPLVGLAAKPSKPNAPPRTNEQFLSRIRYALNSARLQWRVDELPLDTKIMIHPVTLRKYEDCGIVIPEMVTVGGSAEESFKPFFRTVTGYGILEHIHYPPGWLTVYCPKYAPVFYDTGWRPQSY